jgi:hypothetical protein
MLRIVREDEICRRLMAIPGVGPLVPSRSSPRSMTRFSPERFQVRRWRPPRESAFGDQFITRFSIAFEIRVRRDRRYRAIVCKDGFHCGVVCCGNRPALGCRVLEVNRIAIRDMPRSPSSWISAAVA